jgi:hypothetical protein
MYGWAARPEIPHPKLQALKTLNLELQISERQFSEFDDWRLFGT